MPYPRPRRLGSAAIPAAAVSSLLPVLLLFTALLSLPACGDRDEPKSIDLTEREAVDDQPPTGSRLPLRVAVGAMIVPRQGFLYYKELLDYVGEQLGRPVKIVDRESYAEINDLLEGGGIDAAFVCSGPYVEGNAAFGLELLAVPVAYGRPVYYSYTIVHRDSAIEDFEGLRGGTFAFTDPQSNSGKLVPTHHLATMGETPESFFSSTTFTFAHDKSIIAVAEKLVDGAAVDSLIWDYADKVDPQYTAMTKIVWKSASCGIPPIVVRKGLDMSTKEKLREILFTVHESERGREILERLMIDRFVPGNDGLYDSIREMKRFEAEFSKGTEN